MPARIFTVTPESWDEHRQAGIAAINDPAIGNEANPHHMATRDKALAEISGIRAGDRLYFYVQRQKVIMGGYEATCMPFFDREPLFQGAQVVDASLPIRVGFKQVHDFKVPIRMRDIWASRDRGDIWTIQQARGDVAGRHACVSITKHEADLIDEMLMELNPYAAFSQRPPELPEFRKLLPYRFDREGNKRPNLRFEATLQASILEGLAESRWKDIFGDYDDFVAYAPTSEGTEIDLVIMKHKDNGSPLWFMLLELKKARFDWPHLKQLLDYETWMTAAQAAGNPRSVHMVACGYQFSEEVVDHVRKRKSLQQKPIVLLQYSIEAEAKSPADLNLSVVDPSNPTDE
ncbi:MAG: hypothetical protein HY784_05940 [Chloroflexi bacterium]|nr:hypothetical protein [Chloroflexota bacterium]